MYLKIEELKTVMRTIFSSTELDKVNFTTVSDTDLGVLLERATRFIDSIKYRGQFVELNQSHAFPRVIDGVTVEVNDSVKAALGCYVYHLLDIPNNNRYVLQRSGVSSWSSGDESESYVEGSKYASESFEMIKGYLYPYLWDSLN
jgi:hypothetical protein